MQSYNSNCSFVLFSEIILKHLYPFKKRQAANDKEKATWRPNGKTIMGLAFDNGVGEQVGKDLDQV